MNISNIHISRALVAATLCALAAACSQDDPATFRQGKYPLMFKTSVDGMRSRAEVSDPWVFGDEIGVRINEYPTIGRYTLNANGTVNKSDEPLSWPDERGIVRAWYPLKSIDQTVDLTDQSKGYHDLDFLMAQSEEVGCKDEVSLNFTHQMAKVSCVLKQGESISDEEFKSVKVYFNGNTAAKFSQTGLEGSGSGWITPDSVNTALVVPQNMEGQEFIKIDLTVLVNNYPNMTAPKSMIYKPGAGFANLQPGMHYIYNITVQKDRLEVNEAHGEWTDGRDPGSATLATFRVNMTKGYPKEGLVFSEEARLATDANGDYLEVTGNNFTMYYDATNVTGKFSCAFKGFDRDGMDKIEILDDEGKPVSTQFFYKFHLRSGQITTLTCKLSNLAVGDFLYQDGTYDSEYFYDSENPCIGIVFQVGAKANDKADVYKDINGNQLLETIQGYAVALTDAMTPAGPWGPGSSFKETTSTTTYDGFTNYSTALKQTAYKPATCYALASVDVKYKVNVPTPDINDGGNGSSGWYIPSVQQLKDIYAERENIMASAAKLPETVVFDEFLGKRYWSSTRNSSSGLYAVTFGDQEAKAEGKTRNNTTDKHISFVRAIVTF